MPEPVLPTLPGLGWSVTKTPMFSTRKQASVSGREFRIADQLYPIWEWTLTYAILRDQNDTRGGVGLGTGYNELRTLQGFFLARRGSFEPFLFQDPTDWTTTNELLGVGNGTRTIFQLIRTFGGFVEPVTAIQAVTIRVNGVTKTITTDYTVDLATGIVTLLVAPTSGHPVTADITYYFRVRFSDDSAEFENFMYQLWELKQIKFRSVLV